MNPIPIKTSSEIKVMREAGKYHAELTSIMKKYIKAGQTPFEIDEYAHKICKKLKVIPAQIGYKNYPSATCVGINDDVVHCIPSKEKVIKDGDIVTFDSVLEKNGFHADGGFTVGIGSVDKIGKKLIATTEEALNKAIKAVQPGGEILDISKAIYETAKNAGFDVLKNFAGHGVGREMHEPPSIPNYPNNHPTPEMKPGMVLALDTMVTEGIGEVVFDDDGWSTKTKDGKRFAFFEHTVLVTKDGHEVLTK